MQRKRIALFSILSLAALGAAYAAEEAGEEGDAGSSLQCGFMTNLIHPLESGGFLKGHTGQDGEWGPYWTFHSDLMTRRWAGEIDVYEGWASEGSTHINCGT